MSNHHSMCSLSHDLGDQLGCFAQVHEGKLLVSWHCFCQNGGVVSYMLLLCACLLFISIHSWCRGTVSVRMDEWSHTCCFCGLACFSSAYMHIAVDTPSTLLASSACRSVTLLWLSLVFMSMSCALGSCVADFWILPVADEQLALQSR